MRKKLICMILSIIMVSAFFSGCTLIVHNDKKDAQQIVAVVNPITETKKVGDKVISFSSEKKVIYKADLVNYINQNAQNMQQNNQNMTQNQMVDTALKQLTLQQLLLVEADRLLAFGDIEWTQKEDNIVMENIYATIDSQLKTISNELFKENKEDTTSDEKAEEKQPTFPTKPSETTKLDYKYYQFDESNLPIYLKDEKGEYKLNNKGEKIPDYLVWKPDIANYPAMYGSEDDMSREREAVLRFVQLLKDLVKDDFKATASDKSKFAADDKNIENIIKDSKHGVADIYPMLGETHYVKYLIGENAKQSVKISLLQKYITEDSSVKATSEEVTKAYNDALKEQQSAYDADPKKYETDVSGGTVNVIYNKTDSYFYVKHILLPFSEKQQADLKKLQADVKLIPDGKTYKDIRDTEYVDNIKVYAHVNGENDLTNEMSVSQVFAEITSTMSAVQSSPKEAERTFDDLIYKYNTDPGIFSKQMGYAVKRTLATGETGAYMEEFEAVARKMLADKQSIGSVAPTYAVTDHGVHIMYLANTISAGSYNKLDDYQTPGEYKTYRTIFEEKIQKGKDQVAFEDWQSKQITYYENKAGIIVKHEKVLKSLYSK